MSQEDIVGGGQERAPAGIDTSIAHSARMYDWWLGGKDNFAADRAMGAAFIQAIPTIKTMAMENRRFLGRAVRFLVQDAGIRQFLDIGTGIPTSPNLHEEAQALAPDCRVVYVDNDPIVLVHARALMVSTEQGHTEYIHADLREPRQILDDPALLKTLDLDKPVALMMVAVLMLLKDSDDPWARTRELMDALPSGSYLAISHPGREFDEEAMEQIRTSADRGGMTVIPRTRAEVQRFFGDWELLEPGVVPVMAWQPEDPAADLNTAFYWAGIARKR